MPVSGALTDGRALAGRRAGGGGLAAAGGGRGRPGPPRRPATGAIADGLAQDQPVAADLDLELVEVGALEEGGQPIDERRGATVAAAGGERRSAATGGRRRSPRLGRRRPSAGSAAGVGRPLVGHASNRRKTRAVFWPPKPNELLSAVRTSRRAPGRRQVEALRVLVRVVEVDRRRDEPLADGQDRDDGLDGAGGAQGVAEHRLVGGHRDRPGVVAEERPDAPGARPCRLPGSRSHGR